MNSQCNIELFGGLRVEQGKRVITRFRTQKTAVLIAYLAFFGDRMHSREVLIDMLWPDAPSLKAGRISLSVALSSLRNQLEPLNVPAQSLLFADRQSIGVSELVITDTYRFEKAVRDAERARGRKQRDDEKRLLLTALTLYRDNLLPGYYEAWISAQQVRLAEQYRLAVRRLSLLYEEDGDLDSAINCAQRAAKSDPSDEDVSQDLIRLLLKQDGSQEPNAPDSPASATAVKQYRELEKALSATGHTPSAKTRALVAPLLKFSPAAAVGVPAIRRRSRLVSAPSGSATAVAQRELGSVFAVTTTPEPRADQLAAMTNLQTPVAPAPSPLPEHLTKFFGRQHEIATILQVLDAGKQRLITLTGPGGTGKSRIALEIARQQRQRFQEMQDEAETSNVPQVYFVSLLEAVSVELFVAELRSALGVREEQNAGSKPLTALVQALKDKRTFLVLDNFEQIAESGSALLEQLLQQVPGLTCLITSRMRLPIMGEREIPIAPLSTLSPSVFATSAGYGSASLGSDAEISRLLEDYPALAMFVDRAQLAQTDFQINRRNAVSIIELVDRLEGIPLAIELAAARTQVIMPRKMLEMMGKRLDLLVNNRRVTGGRHQSLRETLQFSYDLLSPELQKFFTFLALFRGGFTAEAAEAVTENHIALDLIAQLCDASFLRSTESSDGEIRFQMLETIREFAHEKQQEDDPSRQKRHQAEKRHLGYFASLAEEIDRLIFEGKMQARNLDVLEAEHDNIRAALRRVLRTAPDAYRAGESLRLLASMHNFWFMRNHFTEGRDWDRQFWKRLRNSKENAAAGNTLDTFLLSKSMNGSGVLAMYQGDYLEADRCYRYSLRLRRKIDDKTGIAATLNNAGISSSRQRKWSQARSYYEQCFDAWRAAGDSRFIQRLFGNLGVVAAEQEDYKAAKKYFEDHLEFARRVGEMRGISMGLSNLGRTYYKIGDLEKAETLLTESLNLAHQLKDYGLAGAVLLCFGLVRSARAAKLGTAEGWMQAELETGPQFLRVAIEVYQELNVTIPTYAAADMEQYPAATFKANGFPFTGVQALKDILERWLPEHAL